MFENHSSLSLLSTELEVADQTPKNPEIIAAVKNLLSNPSPAFYKTVALYLLENGLVRVTGIQKLQEIALNQISQGYLPMFFPTHPLTIPTLRFSQSELGLEPSRQYPFTLPIYGHLPFLALVDQIDGAKLHNLADPISTWEDIQTSLGYYLSDKGNGTFRKFTESIENSRKIPIVLLYPEGCSRGIERTYIMKSLPAKGNGTPFSTSPFSLIYSLGHSKFFLERWGLKGVVGIFCDQYNHRINSEGLVEGRIEVVDVVKSGNLPSNIAPLGLGTMIEDRTQLASNLLQAILQDRKNRQ